MPKIPNPPERAADPAWSALLNAVREAVASAEQPMHLDDLLASPAVARAVAACEPQHADELLDDALLDVGEAFGATDGRVAHRPRLLEGMVLTHRLSAEEVADGHLLLATDLGPLLELELREIPTAQGPAFVRLPDLSQEGPPAPWTLELPPGVLAGGPGDLVAVRWSDGTLSLEAVHEAPGGGRAAQELAHTFAEMAARDEAAREEGVIELGTLVLETLLADPRVLRTPAPPLSELLVEAELSVRGDYVAVSGFDWDAWQVQRAVVGALALPMRAQNLDFEQSVRLKAALDIAEQFGAGPRGRELLPAEGARAAAALTDMGVLNAFLDEVLHDGQRGVPAGDFAEAVLAHAGRGERASLHVLRAEQLVVDGRPEEAEQALRAALDDDREHPFAHFTLARTASDRGDALRALSHLNQLDLPDDDAFRSGLVRYAEPGPTTARRNDPCPCGSGRKHKVCCAARNGWPLPDRFDWLVLKVRWSVSTGIGLERSVAVAEELADDPEEVLERAISDPLVHDLALFEGGGLQAFLDERGSLLPADELELLRSWPHRPRVVAEVTARHEHGIELLDVRSGKRTLVDEGRDRAELDPGDAVQTRLLPDGSGYRLAPATTRVPVGGREALLELIDEAPRAEQLARALLGGRD